MYIDEKHIVDVFVVAVYVSLYIFESDKNGPFERIGAVVMWTV